MSELSRFKLNTDADRTPASMIMSGVALALASFAAIFSGLCLAHCTGLLTGEGVTITYTPMEDLTPEQRETLFDFEMTDAATMEELLGARAQVEINEAARDREAIELIENALRNQDAEREPVDLPSLIDPQEGM